MATRRPTPGRKSASAKSKPDTSQIKLALKNAGANLAELRRALVTRGSTATGMAALARTVASELGFEAYVRWLDCEIRGYDQGPLGAVLGVDASDELPKRVASYRRQRGNISIATQTRDLEDLPYSITFPDPLSTIEHYAAMAAQRANPEFTTNILTAAIPQAQIREWLERFGVTVLPVTFAGDTHARILAGFKGEIARVVSEFEATIRFYEELMSSEDDTPKIPSQVNNFNIHNSPVGNLNLGTQGNVSVDQDVTQGIEALKKVFDAYATGLTGKDRDMVDDVRRYHEEALLTNKSSDETTALAKKVSEAAAEKPALRDRLVKMAKELPVKIGEHLVLAKLSHVSVALCYHILALLGA